LLLIIKRISPIIKWEDIMKSLKEKFGLRLQELRKSLGLTQDNVAEKINMDTPNLSNIENGKRFMTPQNIEKIADVLGVDVKSLFEFEHHQSKGIVLKEIQEYLDNASPEEIIFIYKTIKNLKEYDN
jgi:transcriptional regulator with XRE-family HTH domain